MTKNRLCHDKSEVIFGIRMTDYIGRMSFFFLEKKISFYSILNYFLHVRGESIYMYVLVYELVL